jgi:outer membrane autotransporter protein
VHASAKSALIENTLLTQNAITNRLRSAFNEPVATPSIEPLGYGPESKQPAAFNSVVDKDRVAATYGGWAQGYGHWLKQDGNSNVGEFSASSGGFVAGVDTTIADSWRVGVLAGYGQTSFHSNDRASSGNSDNYTLGAYAGSQWAMSHGVLAFSSGIAYTWHQLETERSVAFNGFSDRLNADYDAGSLVAFGELGYKIAAGRSTFEPYANLTNVYHKTNGFNETGNTLAALNVDSDKTNTVFTTLGLRAATTFDLGNISPKARADIGWRHAYGDVDSESSARFTGSDIFTVGGTPVAKDVATLEAGLDFNLLPSTVLGVAYTGQFAKDVKQNGFNVKLAVSF